MQAILQKIDDSLEYLDLLHLSITSDELSIKEETIDNLLGILQNLTAMVRRTKSAGGVNVVTYKIKFMYINVSLFFLILYTCH